MTSKEDMTDKAGWETPKPMKDDVPVGERWPQGSTPALTKDYGKSANDQPATKKGTPI